MVGAVIAKDLTFLVATYRSIKKTENCPLGQKFGH
jgi:hypothetical protein